MRTLIETTRLLMVAVSATIVVACTESAPETFGAPLLFVGTLEVEALSTKRSCDDGVDSLSVCISNACGMAEATFTVETVLAGAHSGQRGVLRYTIGEWCEPMFLGTSTALVCVSEYKDGEHRFLSMPIHRTDEGDVVLTNDVARLGNIDLEPLLKPLPEAISYSSGAGKSVFAVQGVFLTDLAQRVSDGQWKPRQVTLAPDEFGGYVERTDSATVDGEDTPPDQSYLRFFEC